MFLSFLFSNASKRIVAIGDPLKDHFPLNKAASRWGQRVQNNTWWLPLFPKAAKERSNVLAVKDNTWSGYFDLLESVDFKFIENEPWQSDYQNPASLHFSEGTDIGARFKAIATNGAGHTVAYEAIYIVKKQDRQYLFHQSQFDPDPVELGRSQPVVWLPPICSTKLRRSIYHLLGSLGYATIEDAPQDTGVLLSKYQQDFLEKLATSGGAASKELSRGFREAETMNDLIVVVNEISRRLECDIVACFSFWLGCNRVARTLGYSLYWESNGQMAALERCEPTQKFLSERYYFKTEEASRFVREPADAALLATQMQDWLHQIGPLTADGEPETILSYFLEDFWEQTEKVVKLGNRPELMKWKETWEKALMNLLEPEQGPGTTAAEQGEARMEETKVTESPVRIFVSHSSRDANLAKAIVTLLKSSLDIKRREIRCSSLESYSLPLGQNIATVLKEELTGKKVLILGLITKSSMKSNWVLFELGAAWALEHLTIPILGPDADWSDVPEPIQGNGGMKFDDSDKLSHLIDTVAKSLGISPESHSAISAEVKTYLSAAEAISKEYGKDNNGPKP